MYEHKLSDEIELIKSENTIGDKKMKIAVAGTGYVGLVTGVCLASKGHLVSCVDIAQNKVDLMNRGISPIFEDGLEELMKANLSRLTFTTDYRSAYQNAEVIFIGVGTPEKRDGSANLSFVYKVCEQIAESVTNDCVVVVKSTVPIGTNDKVERFIANKLKNNVKVYVASNPEFLSQGTAVKDTLNAARIIIGIEDERAGKVLKEVYKDFNTTKIITDRRSAEMIKYASNDFLALKISYINEIANLCEIVGANCDDVSTGMGLDPRIGNRFLNAGIGYGGSCFPKDTKALNWFATFNDNELKTIKAAIEVNENQKLKLIKKAKKYYENFNDLIVAVLGLTFKPGTDDLREAPSLINIPMLVEDGANVQVWDPVGMGKFKAQYTGGVQYCENINEALAGADICFIFTDWDQIKNMDISIFENMMKTPIILDGRNCFELEKVKKYKVIYESIGRPSVINLNIENE